MLVVTGIFHANSVLHTPVGFTLVLLLLIFSGLCVIFSVVLLLGLFLDNRLLLIPWLTVVSMTTLLDVALSLYFVTDLRVNPFVIAMYVVDYTLCSINIYAILCVLSQYQEYAVGRRAMGQKSRAALPVLSGYSSRGDRSKLSSVATWPSRMQPQSKQISQTSTSMVTQSTVPNGDTAAGAGSKLSPHRGLLEATSAFAAGPEELSSGLHISTAETSLQPSGDDTDLQENSCVLDVSKAEDDGNTESRAFIADARSARGAVANRDSNHALVVPVPETRPLLEVTSATYTAGSDDGQDNHV
ncbi:uncharacterized protein LOC119381161 [Rhipicephalus sanguineus]|uniref:uncharacterized protein LOC119381161 n=1 Tax=Rhipicephalus sanguineus TaxID=34632 RepID=UPI001894B77C|nr:uncharacterized protein LOC119381161 [Rhipicephalus sanguineus]